MITVKFYHHAGLESYVKLFKNLIGLDVQLAVTVDSDGLVLCYLSYADLTQLLFDEMTFLDVECHKSEIKVTKL